MKLFTINAHSLQERNYPRKLEQFAEGVARERPQLVAMQEVNQTMTAPPAEGALLAGYVPAPGHSIPVRRDNHAAQVAGRLRSAGLPCSWTWLPIKRGYLRYDEGLAVLSLAGPIAQTDAFRLSGCSHYADWRTRKALGVRLEGRKDWFYSVHFGWWNDRREPFSRQWAALEAALAEKKAAGPVWLLGDFNAPAEVRAESYDLIAASGWLDTYRLAGRREGRATIRGAIDGWRGRMGGRDGLRLDQIWCSRPQSVALSRVLFDGERGPVVSDHFGLMAETV